MYGSVALLTLRRLVGLHGEPSKRRLPHAGSPSPPQRQDRAYECPWHATLRMPHLRTDLAALALMRVQKRTLVSRRHVPPLNNTADASSSRGGAAQVLKAKRKERRAARALLAKKKGRCSEATSRRGASRHDEQSPRSGVDKQPRGGEEEEEEEEEEEKEKEEGEEPRVSDATAQCSRPTLRTSRTLGGPYVDAGCQVAADTVSTL
ncbi:unnamed protein product [Prorocentrum cordatum]|uniref:Uncharacterized protein n=1 Tax=Prorocentrum cordatum TaxID=2364126 RepID=A0ABN9T0S2_9DINO|nr:unnamed protein product [Polarella glacialis]